MIGTPPDHIWAHRHEFVINNPVLSGICSSVDAIVVDPVASL